MPDKVAVVMPTFNEKDNLEGMIHAIMDILPEAQIIIVDDASSDGTGAIANKLAQANSNIHVIHRYGKKGLGLAYRDGFRYVLSNLDAAYIFEMDSDFSHDPKYLPLFLDYAGKYDLVVGSRFLKGGSVNNRAGWRNAMSIFATRFTNGLLGLGLSDLTGGFKCFKRSTLEAIDFNKLSSAGYAFQIEISYYVIKSGGKVKELPIIFRERKFGASKISYKVIAEAVFIVLKLAFKRMEYGSAY